MLTLLDLLLTTSALLLSLQAPAQDPPKQDPPKQDPNKEAAPREAAPNEVAPAEVAAADRPKGLLEIAESEALRTQRALKEKILGNLRSYAMTRDAAPKQAMKFLEEIVQFGPDAAQILLEVLRGVGSGSTDATYAGPAVRAIAGIFEEKKNVALLKSLAEVARSGNYSVRVGILEGLENLDHLLVVEMVAPILQEPDPVLRKLAVRVLGNQKSSAEASGLLRPLLKQEGAPWPETLRALQQLGDRGSLEDAQAWIAKSADATLVQAALGYLADLGGKASLPVLRGLLKNSPPNLTDATLRKAVDAVQLIGLRESDAKKTAEDILVDVFKHHAAFGVREAAKWQLGPYQNEEALKALEEPVMAAIKNDKGSRNNIADLWIEIARIRLQFEKWGKVVDALKRAQAEDDKGLRTDMIEPLRAAALCGNGDLNKAEAILRGMTPEDRADLLERYPVLEKMAKDSKYKDLFPAR